MDTIKQRGENKRRGFTTDEIGKVLKQCDKAGGEWRGLILTGLYTGQRLGDVAGLTWQQVDLTKKTVSFVTNKTSKRLAFSLAKPLADYLLTLPSADKPNAYVFPKAAAMADKHTGDEGFESCPVEYFGDKAKMRFVKKDKNGVIEEQRTVHFTRQSQS